MMIDWKKVALFLWRKKSAGGDIDEQELRDTLTRSKERRQQADSKIDGMIATLDGCGDRWFLDLKSTIDECNGEEFNGAET